MKKQKRMPLNILKRNWGADIEGLNRGCHLVRGPLSKSALVWRSVSGLGLTSQGL